MRRQYIIVEVIRRVRHGNLERDVVTSCFAPYGRRTDNCFLAMEAKAREFIDTIPVELYRRCKLLKDDGKDQIVLAELLGKDNVFDEPFPLGAWEQWLVPPKKHIPRRKPPK